MRPTRVATALLAAASVASWSWGAAGSNAAGSNSTSAGVAISAVNVASSVSRLVVPLAGDAQRLVYAEVNVGSGGGPETATAELEQYAESAGSSDIGRTPLEHSGYARLFSLAGSMLTTAPEPFANTTLDWWDLATGTSGTATTSGQWLGSAADGWYEAVGSRVMDHSTDGSSRVLATVFGGNQSIVSGTVGPAGVVVAGDGGGLAYVTFGGTATRLRSAWSHHGDIDHDVSCRGTSSTQTVCAVYADLGENDSLVTVQRVPLNGGAPAKVSDVCAGDGGLPSAAFTATSLLCGDDVVTSQRLVAAGKVATSPYLIGHGLGAWAPQIVPALGAGVVANADQTRLELVTSAAAHPRRLVTASRSRSTVSAFSLSSGEVEWTTNQPAASQATPGLSVRNARLAASSAALTVGRRKVVATKAAAGSIAVSGETVAYAVTVSRDGLEQPAVRVVSPEHSTLLRNVKSGSVSVSGNRVLYRSTALPGFRHGRFMLLDAATGRTEPVPVLNHALHDDPNLAVSAIWGNYIAYIDREVLSRLNLKDGKSLRVSAKTSGSNDGGPYVYGRYVGWHSTTGDITGGTGRGYYRDLATSAPAVALPTGTFIWALTNTGIVTDRTNDWHDVGNGNLTPNTYYLRRYASGSDDKTILTAPHAQGGAQVSDSVLAWLDATRVVRAALLAPTPITPLSLGAPYAPRRFELARGARWQPDVRFSAALSSCRLTISHDGTTVRSLPCAPQAMAVGDAMVSWNGRDRAGNRATVGTYQWTVTVKGTSAVSKHVSGQLQVSRQD